MIPIQLDSLKKYYGTSVGVEDVSFCVNAGEVFGFIGPNGAGKSTAIRVLMGFLRPTGGSADILGINCFTNGEKARAQVGYVPAEVAAYPNMTAKQFLKYTAELKGRGADRIEELAVKFELPLNRKIAHLSTGNKKKISIISALISTPKVLIFDEPTSGLDPLMQQVFFSVLDEERQRGTAILLSSHNLTEVQKICDRVGIIKRGKVISVESVKALRDKTIKNVEFTTKDTKPEVNLIGVKNLTVNEKTYKFKYVGDMKDLINYLSTLDLLNVSITDSNLDEMFLHYYD
ncbi:MAG: ABC transporter ATP-binding protein [Firmicutes bacterium]|nr:ABC transporter ATP-binding protein [Bacillota bacterium]